MTGRSEGELGLLVVLAAVILFLAVLAWAILPYLQSAIRLVPR